MTSSPTDDTKRTKRGFRIFTRAGDNHLRTGDIDPPAGPRKLKRANTSTPAHSSTALRRVRTADGHKKEREASPFNHPSNRSRPVTPDLLDTSHAPSPAPGDELTFSPALQLHLKIHSTDDNSTETHSLKTSRSSPNLARVGSVGGSVRRRGDAHRTPSPLHLPSRSETAPSHDSQPTYLPTPLISQRVECNDDKTLYPTLKVVPSTPSPFSDCTTDGKTIVPPPRSVSLDKGGSLYSFDNRSSTTLNEQTKPEIDRPREDLVITTFDAWHEVWEEMDLMQAIPRLRELKASTKL